MRLKGKTMLITGGASGIGLAMAERALSEGARVVLADLPGSAGLEQARALDADDSRCHFLPCDVTQPDAVITMVEAAAAWLGRIDVVFNNAGIGVGGPALAHDEALWSRVVDINLNGVFRVARAVLPRMHAQRSGSLINCASVLGSFGQTGAAAYSATKAGVINLTRTLAIESAPLGVRVNAVSPGYIDTPLIGHFEPERRAALVRQHPMGRLGRAEEVANAVLFLASDEASFVTGSNLVVDGGYSAGKA